MTEQTNRLSLLNHPIARVLVFLVFLCGWLDAFLHSVVVVVNIPFFFPLMMPIMVLAIIHMICPKVVQAGMKSALKPVLKLLCTALMIRGWRSRLGAVLLLVFLVPTHLNLRLGLLFGFKDVTQVLSPDDIGAPMTPILLRKVLAIVVPKMAIVVASGMLLIDQASKESAGGRRLQDWSTGGGDYSGGGGCSGGGDGSGGGGCSGGGD